MSCGHFSILVCLLWLLSFCCGLLWFGLVELGCFGGGGGGGVVAVAVVAASAAGFIC